VFAITVLVMADETLNYKIIKTDNNKENIITCMPL